MTYNEPGRNAPQYERIRDKSNSMGLILGGLLALALMIGGILWATSTNDTQTASDRPAATTGARQDNLAPTPTAPPNPNR
jgi:hypothetical protein